MGFQGVKDGVWAEKEPLLTPGSPSCFLFFPEEAGKSTAADPVAAHISSRGHTLPYKVADIVLSPFCGDLGEGGRR